MDVLSSRFLLRPADPARSRAFYRDALGLAVHREFGPPEEPGLVFFTGNGLLEVSGRSDGPVGALRCGCRSATSQPRSTGWPLRACRSCASRGRSRGGWSRPG
jgi:catechol 2,3-dioxygenase-like lactoylglutathione lyase family enzyme